MSQPLPRVYVFRKGVELKDHPANGRPCLGFGSLTGKVGEFLAFESIAVQSTIRREYSEIDFEGPVMIKIWAPNMPAEWFAIATLTTVKSTNQDRRVRVPVAC
ncbi:hypothetical protein [Rhodopirellula bahusiensis]|uniref:hypothetical protein n=1 Tax=Rhodopirellula bahusiensis TaxID=2014065 RepID=UPI0032655D30